MITKHLCRLNLNLRRVEGKEFYQEASIGKVNPSFSQAFRSKLFSIEANLTRLKDFSYLTTAKGKNYRKTQFKRTILMLKEKYKKEYGIKLLNSVIENNLKEYLGYSLDKQSEKAKEFFNNRNLKLTDKEKMIKDIENQFEDKFNEISKQESNLIPEIDFDLENQKDLDARQEAYTKNIKRI